MHSGDYLDLDEALVDVAMDALAESLFCCTDRSELRAVEYSDTFDAALAVLRAVMPLIETERLARAI